MDGDGDVDLVGGSYDSGIGVILNEGGDLLFHQLRQGPVPTNSWYDVADLNNDGILDILSASAIYRDFYCVVSAPDGTYHDAHVDPAPAQLPVNYQITLFDFENDGDIDFQIKGYPGADFDQQRLYLNDGNATFALAGPTILDERTILLDFNGDNDLDILAYSKNPNTEPRYLEHKPDGQFVEIPTPEIFKHYAYLNASYCNKLSDTESYAVVRGTLINTLLYDVGRLYRKNNGVYERVNVNPFDVVGEGLAEWIDYDQDGLTDVFTMSHLLKNTGDGFVETEKPVFDSTELHYGTIYHRAWADFDKDGKLDLVGMNDRDLILYRGLQLSPLVLTADTLIKNIDDGSHPVVVDVHKDGTPDLYLPEYGFYTRQDDHYALDFSQGYFKGKGPAAVADYDRDGDDDIVLNSWSEQRIVYAKNNAGNYSEDKTALNVPSDGYGKVYAIDYNADGYTDLLFVKEDWGWANSISFNLLKNNQGTFEAVSSPALTKAELISLNQGYNVSIADVNVDGYPDLWIGGVIDNVGVDIYYENKNGVFTERTITGIRNTDWASYDWADFDNDGDPDLLVGGGNRYDNCTAVYLNNYVETTPGSIVALIPSNGSNAPADGKLAIAYNRRVVKGNGKIRIYSKATSLMLLEVDALDENVSINNNVVNISADANTFFGDVYILVDPGTFKDSKANNLPGISDAGTWVLRAANPGPKILSTVPENDQLNVKNNVTLQITFDKAIKLGAGTVRIFSVETNDLLFTVTLTTSNVSISDKKATIHPGVVLPPNTKVYAQFDRGAFEDLQGNDAQGMIGSTWQFTSGDGFIAADEADVDAGIIVTRESTGAVVVSSIDHQYDILQAYDVLGKNLNSAKQGRDLVIDQPKGFIIVRYQKQATISAIKIFVKE